MYSYSKIECFNECPRKFKYRYIQKLEEPKNIYLEFGTKFHEAISKGESEDKDIDLMVKALHENTEFKKYKDRITEYEKKYVYDYEGGQYISFLDAIGDDFILEFKSSKDKWSDKRFEEENQSALYIKARELEDGDIKKFIYFVVVKPNKKGEVEIQHKEITFDSEKLKKMVGTVEEIERETLFEKKENKYCWFCSFYGKCKSDDAGYKKF